MQRKTIFQYVISYDIVCNKKRRKVAEALKDYGPRMQKSVFECELSADDLKNLIKKLEKIINPEEDSILIYHVCAACFKKYRFLGLKPMRYEKEFEIL